MVILFLVRKTPKENSSDPSDYLVGILGTFSVLMFRPSFIYIALGRALIIIGVLMQVTALISLNRSFGIVAANRGVKKTGLYAFIRHPMYAAYFFVHGGYVIQNFTFANIIVFVSFVILEILRIFSEERLLSHDPEYQEYKKDVKWRLLPYVF
jgi:protein-S-isoprenylcysteine O-methyltransferase Ste14